MASCAESMLMECAWSRVATGSTRTAMTRAMAPTYAAPPAVSAHEQESEATQRRFDALADSQRDVIAHAGRAVLVLGALGVVYGDIGTSPLYTEQVIFSSYRATAHTVAHMKPGGAPEQAPLS